MNVHFKRSPASKKQAILEASIKIVAEEGRTASTKKIARKAGVSEGTIFNHFDNKDDLLNAVFLHIKTTCSAYIIRELYQKGSNPNNTKERLNIYLQWGFSSPLSIRALARLELTGIITKETRKSVSSLLQNKNDSKENFWEEILCNVANQAILKIHDKSLQIPQHDRENLQDKVLSLKKILENTQISHFLTPEQDAVALSSYA